jgi:hypothetical protein
MKMSSQGEVYLLFILIDMIRYKCKNQNYSTDGGYVSYNDRSTLCVHVGELSEISPFSVPLLGFAIKPNLERHTIHPRRQHRRHRQKTTRLALQHSKIFTQSSQPRS